MSASGGVAVAFVTNIYNKIDSLEKKYELQKETLADYKLEAEKTFAKHVDLQQSNIRLEAIMFEMRGDIKDLGNDVKTLIARK